MQTLSRQRRHFHQLLAILLCMAMVLQASPLMAGPQTPSPIGSSTLVGWTQNDSPHASYAISDYLSTNQVAEVPLQSGWHLISIPEEPVDTDPAAVLASIAGRYTQVYAYAGCDPETPWKGYDPLNPAASTLTAIDHTMGLWLDVEDPGLLVVDGIQHSQVVIPLCLGWNLIGYPFNRPQPVVTALASIADDYLRIFTFDAGDIADPWAVFDVSSPQWANDVKIMEPGRGYWLYATANTTLTMTAPPDDVDITPPLVTVTASPTSVEVGEAVLLSVQATDDTGVAEVRLTINRTPVQLNSNDQAVFFPTTAGVYTARATAIDGAGNVGSDSTLFTAFSGEDNGPPTVALLLPEDGTVITGTVDLIGTATDVDFAFYQLEAATAGSQGYFTFFQGSNPVENDVLGKLVAGRFPPGLYDVRVCAQDLRGNRACSAPRRYELNAPRTPPGFARFAFVDGVIDAIGIPLAIHRIYDSRFKEMGDFGMGWQMGLEQVTLQIDGKMGEDWAIQTSGQLVKTYHLVPTRDHRVFISLPDGSIHRFRLRLEPQSQTLFPIETVDSVHFEPLPGTVTKLTTPDDAFFIHGSISGGPVIIRDSDYEVYDPARYTLEFPDGRRFFFERPQSQQKFRLMRMQDADGHTVTIHANGITHSAGASMAFGRDGLGRIETLTANDGRERSYEYDEAGNLAAVTDFAGYRTEFRYDHQHNLLQIVDARGHVPGTLIYDDEGRVIGMVDAAGHRIDISHDDENRQEIVTDPLGNTTIRTYDEAGNLISELDALGHENSYTYDSLGRVVSHADPLGHTQTYAYDTFGNLTAYTNPLGHQWQNVYDEQGRLLEQIDPLNRSVLYEYDANGRPTAMITPRGGRYESSYAANGLPISFKDPNNASFSVGYDAAGRMNSFTDPMGRTGRLVVRPDGQVSVDEYTVDGEAVRYEYLYDDNGTLTGLILPDGRVSSMVYDEVGMAAVAVSTGGYEQSLVYDPRGNVTAFTHYDGSVNHFEYDAKNQVTGFVGPTGERVDVFHDALGRPAAVNIADTLAITSTFDAAGRVIQQEQAGRGSLSFEHDAAGRVLSETDTAGRSTQYEYDAVGNLVVITDTLGYRTQFVYDEDDNLTGIQLPDGNQIDMTYDLLGQMTSYQDERGATINYAHNAAGQVISTTNPVGGVTQYDYHNDLGLLVKATTPTGNAWHFTYDRIGRPTGRAYPWGGSEQFEYDASGRIDRIVDATGVTTHFAYDAVGRPITRTLAGGQIEAREYSQSNRLLRAADASGETIFTYDSAGRTRRIEYANGHYVEYEYSSAGLLTLLRTPAGTTTYSYDGLGRVVSVNDSATGSTAYTYDLAGRVETATLPDGTTTTYAYHARGWLLNAMTLAADGTPLQDVHYTHDASGNPISVTDTVSGRQVQYGFDAGGRVVSEIRSGADSATLAYSYDGDWNLVQKGAQSLAYDGAMRLTDDGIWTSYTYDAAGRPSSRSDGAVTENFSYDSLGRLVQVTRSGGLPATINLTYNYDNLLV
ncbi:MAG: hypothetical protein KF893_10140 [Caldilineaceae bacterium]|nr:hypothetical protein [Caldilineaceae bacterium]